MSLKIGFVSIGDWSTILGADGYQTAGGAAYYRCVLPARTLASKGIDAVYGPELVTVPGSNALGIKQHDGTLHHDIDVMIVQRWMHHAAHDFILAARAEGQIIFQDIDDWFEGIATSNFAWQAQHSKAYPDNNLNHFRRAIGASSGITVSTPFLAEKYARFDIPVFLVPNAIDLARWEQQDVTGDPIFGWVGATAFRSGDLEVLAGVLSPFLEKHGAGFFHGGANSERDEARDFLRLSDKVEYASLPMLSIEEYPQFFSKFNAGVIPLSSAPFNTAKSGIKGLEMAASGIPFVASPSDAYVELAARGAGTLAKNPKQWRNQLERLLDPEDRRTQGAAARAAVAEHYDIDDRWTDWWDAYTEPALEVGAA